MYGVGMSTPVTDTPFLGTQGSVSFLLRPPTHLSSGFVVCKSLSDPLTRCLSQGSPPVLLLRYRPPGTPHFLERDDRGHPTDEGGW